MIWIAPNLAQMWNISFLDSATQSCGLTPIYSPRMRVKFCIIWSNRCRQEKTLFLSVSEGFTANITGLPFYKGCRGILSILRTLPFLNSEDFFLAVMIIHALIPLISKAKVQILSDICSFIWSPKPFWKLFLKAPRVSNGNMTVINHDSEAQRQVGQWGGTKAFKRLDQIVATMAVCLPAARKYLCRNIF